MPHQCVRCNTFHDDGAKEIIKGCSCGSKLFFFISKANMKKAHSMTKDLSVKDKDQIEQDVYDLIGSQKNTDEPVVLDLESINVLKPGKFEIDVVQLFQKDNPLIYKLSEGKYMIDLAETFKEKLKKK